MNLIDRLSPEGQKKFKAKQAESRIEQAKRRWAYNGNSGVLCETVEQYEEIKDIYSEDRPEDNHSLVVKKFGQVRQEIKKAKKELEAKKAEKKPVVKKEEKKTEK